MILHLGDLNELWGEPVFEETPNFDQPLGSVSTDSRTLSQGNFFVPLVVNHFLLFCCSKGHL